MDDIPCSVIPHQAPPDVFSSIPTVTVVPELSDLTTLLRADGSECTCTGPSFTLAFPESVSRSPAEDSYGNTKSAAQHKMNAKQAILTRLLADFIIVILLKVSANIIVTVQVIRFKAEG
jgi:hypothetical protein